MTYFPGGFTLHVERPAGYDPFGARIPGAEFDIEGFAAAPAGSVETNAGKETIIDSDTLYGPYGADVRAGDQVTIPDGQPIAAGDYQVDGTPAQWKNPFTGREFGCVVRLTKPDVAG